MPLPENYFYANGVDPSGGLTPFALVPGSQLGRDNNYKYAVYPTGRIEYAYEAPQPEGATRDVYYSESQLRAAGVNFAGVPRNDHGVPMPAGYNPVGDYKTNDGGANIIGSIAFAVLTLGFGSAVAAGAGAEAATAGADAATTGANAVNYSDAWEGLYSAPSEMDTVYGVSGIESAPAELAQTAQASTLMPPAIPEVDPTFGGTLAESSPGVYTPAPQSNVLGTLSSAADTAAKVAGAYRTARSLLAGGSKRADVSPTASAPWKNPVGGADNKKDGNDSLAKNAVGAGFIFVIVAAILFALFFRR